MFSNTVQTYQDNILYHPHVFNGFIPNLNSIISVMNIVYWMITKFVIFGVWKFLSINKQITFECVHIIEFNLGIKLNTEMVKILNSK
jgi:hypothetical protein